MTRTRGEIERVLELATLGMNQSEIARESGIPRGTVRDWTSGKLPQRAGEDRSGEACHGCARPLDMREPALRSYSYLLGIYLGDGWISAHRRAVFRLRVLLDGRYPKIIRECAEAMGMVIPESTVSIYPHRHQQASQVSSFSKHWPCFLPQHGLGKKHLRRIALLDWQTVLVDMHPWSLLRGLIHSDGSRFINPVRHGRAIYRYPRYSFSNRSADIRAIFCETCDRVGVEWRQRGEFEISIARRESVALMDRYIGAKA
jgi:hypothetical protein